MTTGQTLPRTLENVFHWFFAVVKRPSSGGAIREWWSIQDVQSSTWSLGLFPSRGRPQWQWSKSWLWSRQFCSVILSWYGALSQNRLQSNKVRQSWVITSEMWVKKKNKIFFLFISWESQYFYGDEKLSHYSSFWSFPNNSSLAWFVASWLQRYSHFCILFFLVTLWSSSVPGAQACRGHITFFVPRYIDCA